MTAGIKIYGASDDLVEVEGDVPGCDEFGHYGDEPGFVELSTGDIFSVVYGAGKRAVWQIKHAHKSGKLKVTIQKAPKGDEPDPYTDTAVISGPIEWVEFWENWPPNYEDIREKVMSRLEKIDHSDGMELHRRLFVALFGREPPTPAEERE